MTDENDPDKTPVRTPSAMHRLGLVPCPCCKKDQRMDCELCVDADGWCSRYVPVDKAIAWSLEHGDTDPPEAT